MKIIRSINRQTVIMGGVIMAMFILWSPQTFASGGGSDEISRVEVLFIQGSVKKIFSGQSGVVVKPTSGEKMRIRLDEQTELVGIPLLENLQRGHQVRIWYSGGEENRAVKLEKLPDVGC